MFKNLLSGNKKDAGFTLVELMVVVAIIALLAAVAIPQFRKYQAKARSSEAKLALASLYTAMESYYAEYNHYTSCLGFMGYAPSGTGAERYYWSGFSISVDGELSTPTACSGTASAIALSWAYEGGKVPGGAASMTIVALTDSYVSDNYGFTAGTAGIIDKDFSLTGTVSKFHMNDQKDMTNTQVGY